LDDYEFTLEKLLEMQITKKEKLEVQSLLKEISMLKNNGQQLTLNTVS
jgi:hypothetical protein